MNFYKNKSHWKIREVWIQKNTFYTLNMYIVGRFCSGTPFKCYAVGHRQLRNWSYIIMELGFFTITHHTHYFIHFSCSRREVGEITFLPSSSTSGCYSKKIVSLIFSLRIWEMNKIIGAVCHGKKKPNFIMVLDQFPSWRYPTTYYTVQCPWAKLSYIISKNGGQINKVDSIF